jgi:hypothetical protein
MQLSEESMDIASCYRTMFQYDSSCANLIYCAMFIDLLLHPHPRARHLAHSTNHVRTPDLPRRRGSVVQLAAAIMGPSSFKGTAPLALGYKVAFYCPCALRQNAYVQTQRVRTERGTMQ